MSNVSASTYLLHPPTRPIIPPLTSPSPYTGLGLILDPEDEKSCDPLPMRSLSTAVLVRAPSGSDLTSVSMLQLYLVGCFRGPRSTAAADDDSLDPIARNFYELSVLAHERWRLRVNRILPFHLGALVVMQQALDRGEASSD